MSASAPSARRVYWGALLVLLVGVGCLVGSTLSSVQYYPDSDDGIYRAYMQHIAAHGPSGFPELFRSYVADKSRWILPSPIRIGFIATSALWAKAFGPTLRALSYLSLVSHLAFVALNFAFARRWFGELRALLIAALTAFSCVLLGMSRQALMDSFATLTQALAIWLFLELVAQPSSLRWRIAFMLAFGFAVLVKEPYALLLGPFVAFAGLEKWGRKSPIGILPMAIALCAPLLVVALIYVWAAGGVDSFTSTVRVVRQSLATNEWARQFLSGPWYRYILDYLLLSPWTTLLAIAYLGALALHLRAGEWDRAQVWFALVGVLLLFEFSFIEKDVRYLMVLELPIRVFALFMLETAIPKRFTARRGLVSAILVALLCASEWASFHDIFVSQKTYDPTSAVLMNARDLLPGPTK